LTAMSATKVMLTPLSKPSQLGERIARSRRSLRLSQRAVCRHTGLDPSYLSRLEGGKVQPTVATVLRIARAFDMSLDELLGPSPQQARGARCPVSHTGACLLERQHHVTERRPPVSEIRRKGQLDLLRRFSAVVQRGDPELLTALDVLLREIEQTRR
jgi:transcriptional regulator with XRE-family HTH domain